MNCFILLYLLCCQNRCNSCGGCDCCECKQHKRQMPCEMPCERMDVPKCDMPGAIPPPIRNDFSFQYEEDCDCNK